MHYGTDFLRICAGEHARLWCFHVHFRCLVSVRTCVCGCVVCVWMFVGCVRVCSSVPGAWLVYTLARHTFISLSLCL